MRKERVHLADPASPTLFPMSPRRTFLSYVAIIIACLLPVTSWAHEDTELDKVMEKLNGAMKRINRQVNDASKNADSLKEVALAIEQAKEAKKHQPALTKDKADKDK